MKRFYVIRKADTRWSHAVLYFCGLRLVLLPDLLSAGWYTSVDRPSTHCSGELTTTNLKTTVSGASGRFRKQQTLNRRFRGITTGTSKRLFSWQLFASGMTKYITGLTGAIVDIVCKYYIGPSVACLSVLSSASAVAVATQWRADRRWRVYDCPTAAHRPPYIFIYPGHVVLLNAQSVCPSADRWSHSHAIGVTRHCYIINGRWCRQWRRWGRWCI